jgi:hypothetical protein
LNIPKGFSRFFFVDIQFFSLFLKKFQKNNKKTSKKYIIDVFTSYSASFLKNLKKKGRQEEEKSHLLF